MKNLLKIAFLATLFFGAVQSGFSRGDKVIPQVADGSGWITKFDLTNISRVEPVEDMWLVFYRSDGNRWDLPTNYGTGEIQLRLAPRQTIRIETLGESTGSGYAVIYDEEPANTTYSEDFVLGISVFYVFSNSSGVAETLTIPVAQPTAAANAPMEMNFTQLTSSALAIVNLGNNTNSVKIDLYSENGQLFGTKTMELAPTEHFTGYLDHPRLFSALFSNRQNYKGMAQITSRGPIAMLTLLQTQTVNGPQYSTLAPVDRESLRRNSYLVALQLPDLDNPFLPVDLDYFTVDYSRTRGTEEDTETYSWDLEYRHNPSNPASRQIRAVTDNGAALVAIGDRTGNQFDTISLPTLKSLSYSTTGIIDLSTGSSSLKEGFTFAVRTDLGHYAKVRILRIIETIVGLNSNYRDLILEVYLYR